MYYQICFEKIKGQGNKCPQFHMVKIIESVLQIKNDLSLSFSLAMKWKYVSVSCMVDTVMCTQSLFLDWRIYFPSCWACGQPTLLSGPSTWNIALAEGKMPHPRSCPLPDGPHPATGHYRRQRPHPVSAAEGPVGRSIQTLEPPPGLAEFFAALYHSSRFLPGLRAGAQEHILNIPDANLWFKACFSAKRKLQHGKDLSPQPL